MWVWVWVHMSSKSYCRMMVHYWFSPRVNPPPHPTTLCPFLHSLLVLPSPYIPLPLPGLWLLSSRSPPPSLLPSSLPHPLHNRRMKTRPQSSPDSTVQQVQTLNKLTRLPCAVAMASLPPACVCVCVCTPCRPLPDV